MVCSAAYSDKKYRDEGRDAYGKDTEWGDECELALWRRTACVYPRLVNLIEDIVLYLENSSNSTLRDVSTT